MRFASFLLFVFLGFPAKAADPASYDALIVLGAGAPPEGWANPVLVERVCKAVQERKAGRAGRLIMSGGTTAGHIAEAEMMRAVAVAMGVPARDVLIEPSSVDTRENAAFTLRLARAAGIRSAALVTHRSHLGRARETFELVGAGYWKELGGIEADGALSSECFPPAKPLVLGSTVDMLIIDVSEDQPIEERFDLPEDVPTRRLVEEVLAAGRAYQAGKAKRLYFAEPRVGAAQPRVGAAEPVLSSAAATLSRGAARGHISRTELARIVASAFGVAFDDITISSARRFGQVPGAVEPADDPWSRIPKPKLAVFAPAGEMPWWRDHLSRGLNAALPAPEFLP